MLARARHVPLACTARLALDDWHAVKAHALGAFVAILVRQVEARLRAGVAEDSPAEAAVVLRRPVSARYLSLSLSFQRTAAAAAAEIATQGAIRE